MDYLTPTMRKAMEQGAAQSPAQSAHAQHAVDRKVRIDKAITEKRAAAKARCEAGDHTLVGGGCIVCKKDPHTRDKQVWSAVKAWFNSLSDTQWDELNEEQRVEYRALFLEDHPTF